MSKLEILNIRIELQNELIKAEMLGFDYACQAINAILTHSDWASRWDCLHPEYAQLVNVGNQYRQVRGLK